MTLPIMEFMRRFLQHVLPRGFMKVRYYGFLSPSASVPLEDVKARIEMASGFALAASETTSEPPAALRCRHCGGALRFSRLLLPGDSAIGSLAALGQRAGESSTLSAAGGPEPGPPRRPRLGSAPLAARRPGDPSLTRSRNAHGPARPRCARHHAPSTS